MVIQSCCLGYKRARMAYNKVEDMSATRDL
jgi:hypothetical protein